MLPTFVVKCTLYNVYNLCTESRGLSTLYMDCWKQKLETEAVQSLTPAGRPHWTLDSGHS